jgi:hypothetical protein
MTLSALDKLLIEVLGRQKEHWHGAELTEERIRAVLQQRALFDDRERFLLASSPIAREIYAQIWAEVDIDREACRRRWANAGLATSTGSLRAATTHEHYPIEIEGMNDDFLVTIRRNPLQQGWLITLSLRERFRRAVKVGDVLAMVDDRNVRWIVGSPNEYGELHTSDWPYVETPWERIRQHGFVLYVQAA